MLALIAALAAYAPPQLAPPAMRHAPIIMASPPPPAKSGYYKRPSAALEQGGSFYVPGLEGSRLRVGGAAVLAVGLVLNRVLSPGEPVSSQVVSEALGAIGCVIILVQSALQARIEAQIEEDELRAAFASRNKERQELSASLEADALRAARAKWAAGALLRVTPARAVLWVDGDDSLVLKCGRFPDADDARPPSSGAPLRALLPAGATSAVLDTLDDAPPPPLPSNAASALVCACGGGGVVVITSEQRGAFTPTQQGYLERCCALLAEVEG